MFEGGIRRGGLRGYGAEVFITLVGAVMALARVLLTDNRELLLVVIVFTLLLAATSLGLKIEVRNLLRDDLGRVVDDIGHVGWHEAARAKVVQLRAELREWGSAALAEDERLEFIVSEAGDGEAGLARIAAEEPEVVLLDLNMPRLDGHAVLRQVKERWPQIRVIVLSGSDSNEDCWRAEQAGVDAFVEKRLALPQLSALIASL